MKIGIVDLDTSHPPSWIPAERELGHEIAGVYDGGSVHPPGYAAEFAEEFDIPTVYDSLKKMANAVDCAIIHSCDWDTHVAKAAPFVEAGRSVLVDKPIAGNLRDLIQFRNWVDGGARITGGSSLAFCCETRNWLAKSQDERGCPHTAYCGCAVDDFNYGIHAYALLSGIMGSGAQSVRFLGKHVQRRIQVNWPDGRMGFLIVGAAASWQPFYASISTEKGAIQYQPAPGDLYKAILAVTLPYLAGEADAPRPFNELIEPELMALAAKKSWTENGREVLLSELTEADEGYDGQIFAASYRKQKYPDN